MIMTHTCMNSMHYENITANAYIDPHTDYSSKLQNRKSFP